MKNAVKNNNKVEDKDQAAAHHKLRAVQSTNLLPTWRRTTKAAVALKSTVT